MLLSIFTSVFTAQAANEYNTAVRHELCASLSADAQAYYTGSYSWTALSASSGSSSASSLDAMDSQLYQKLYTLMSTTMTSSVSYKSLDSYWEYTDSESGASAPTLFYSDETSSSFNREHVWPKSHASFYQKNGGADLHHLRPTNSNINSTRNNYVFGNVKGVLSSYSTKDYNGKTVLWYKGGQLVEVADNVKGDVARILLYVYVRWKQPNLFEDVSSAYLPSFDSDDSQNTGTNSAAASAMLKSGADRAATGENAIKVACRTADIIAGPVGIVMADALLGEMTPTAAEAVGSSVAHKVLVPVSKCNISIAGLADIGAAAILDDAARLILEFSQSI